MSLPTTTGPYWWREKDGDEWVLVEVELIGADLFAQGKGKYKEYCAYIDQWEIFYPIGQWKRIPRPDDGIEAWAVFVEGMIRCHSIASTKEAVEEQLAFFESMHNKKCTVEAVTIYRKEKK